MITCPWCGTNYTKYQPNCTNCGGPLPLPAERFSSEIEESPPLPPPPPRPISNNYAWRLLSQDGWAVAAFVFLLLGAIFAFVGVILTIGVITAFVGIPFALLGFLFLIGGGAIVVWRYQAARQVVQVLREGKVMEGRIMDVAENYNVQINGRNPWTITYQFQLDGRDYQGRVTTLNAPGVGLQAGKRANVLYLPNAPQHNVLYPHP